MNEFRLLSTKQLSLTQQQRLLGTGVTFSSWDFIQTKPLPYQANFENKWLIFTSQNAVNAVEKDLKNKRYDCFCVGEKTKLLLEKNGQKVIKMAKNASILADFLEKRTKNRHFLFLTGTLRRPEIEASFGENNSQLEIVEVYTTVAQPKALGEFDGILFFSPSGVASFLQHNSLNNSRCFAIGDTTAKALKNHHPKALITATQPTVEHLIAAVKKNLSKPL